MATLGNASQPAGSTGTAANAIYLQRVLAPSAGTLTSVEAWLASANASYAEHIGVVYTDVAGVPGVLVDNSAAFFGAPDFTMASKTVALPDAQAITSSTYYWVGIQVKHDSTSVSTEADSGNAWYYFSPSAFGVLPADFAGLGSPLNLSRYGFSATYTTAGPSHTLATLAAGAVVGGTGYNGTTTGMAAITSLTNASITSTSANAFVYAMNAFAHGVPYLNVGTPTFTASDGTLSATLASPLATMAGYTAVTMGTMNTGAWSIGKDPAIVTGDVVHLPTAAGTLNTDGTLTDYIYGTYTMWRRDVSNGNMYTSTLTVSQLSITGTSSTASAGNLTATGGGATGITGVSSTASAGTMSTSSPVDTTPTQFTFDDVYGAALTTEYPSNDITISGVAAATNIPITIVGGTYSINSGGGYGAYTAVAGNVQLGYLVRVKVTSSGTNETAVSTTLTVGGVSDVYTVTTAAASGGGGFQGTITRNVTSNITP